MSTDALTTPLGVVYPAATTLYGGNNTLVWAQHAHSVDRAIGRIRNDFPILPSDAGVPEDEAVATYVGSGTSDTRAALDMWHQGLQVWLNPHDYGAAGDGTTDDTAALQAAVDAAAGGGVVRLHPDRVYRISSSLILSSDAELRGPGAIICYTGINAVTATNQDRVTIRDLSLSFPLTGAATNQAGIRIQGGTAHRVTGVTVTGFRYGIQMVDTTEVEVSRCRLTGQNGLSPAAGIIVTGATSGARLTRLHNNIVSTVTGHGIYVTQEAYTSSISMGLAVVGNVVTSCTLDCIRVQTRGGTMQGGYTIAG